MTLVMEEAALYGLLFGGGGLASSLLDTAAETGTALQPVPCLRGTFCSLHLNFFFFKDNTVDYKTLNDLAYTYYCCPRSSVVHKPGCSE